MKSKLSIDTRGSKRWKLPNGNLHREDGPAIEYGSGDKEWWVNGIEYSEQEYKAEMRSIKLKLLLK